MQFTGRNLLFVRTGIEYALGEISNQIGTCPDFVEYADDIERLEQEREQYEKLLARIDKALVKEEMKE